MDTSTPTAPTPPATPPAAAPAAASALPAAMAKAREPKLDKDPVDAWPALQRWLLTLLRRDSNRDEDFLQRLTFIENGIRTLTDDYPDASLFVLVQMLFDSHSPSYSTTHALLSALICRLIAPKANLPESEQMALVRAALTMNIGMLSLHDKLARQAQDTSAQQREEIRAHPHKSMELLRSLGVRDSLWLNLVLDHHENPDGTGYPNGKTELSATQQLLHMSDIFVACISPRASRRGMSPNLAVGNLYLEAKEQFKELSALFVKQLGLYPPGTYVRLKSEEVAVVVRRGEMVHTPLVMSILDGDGMPMTTPVRRETQLKQHAIKESVAPEDIRVRLDTGRLLRRV